MLVMLLGLIAVFSGICLVNKNPEESSLGWRLVWAGIGIALIAGCFLSPETFALPEGYHL
jgi:hypothetical protein